MYDVPGYSLEYLGSIYIIAACICKPAQQLLAGAAFRFFL